MFNEPQRAAMETRLSGAVLHAPSLIATERASVCLKKIRQGTYSPGVLLKMYAAFDGLAISKDHVDLSQTILMAQSKSLSVYDASYLWLAHQLGAELVTLDVKLARAATP